MTGGLLAGTLKKRFCFGKRLFESLVHHTICATYLQHGILGGSILIIIFVAQQVASALKNLTFAARISLKLLCHCTLTFCTSLSNIETCFSFIHLKSGFVKKKSNSWQRLSRKLCSSLFLHSCFIH